MTRNFSALLCLKHLRKRYGVGLNKYIIKHIIVILASFDGYKQCCEENFVEAVHYLVLNGCCNNDVFIWAVTNRQATIIELLVENGIDVNWDDDLGLCVAAENGFLEMVVLLLRLGANANNDYALRWAAHNGHTKIVELLLEAGADIHSERDVVLRWAGENGHIETVKLLFEKGAIVNPIGNKLLLITSEFNNYEMVKLLLIESGNKPWTS